MSEHRNRLGQSDWVIAVDTRRGPGRQRDAPTGGGLTGLALLAAEICSVSSALVVLPKPILRIIDPDIIERPAEARRVPEPIRALLGALPTHDPDLPDGEVPIVRVRPDHDAPFRLVAVLRRDGELLGALILEDVTDRQSLGEREDQRLRAAARAVQEHIFMRRRLEIDRDAVENAKRLQRELNHRVRNTLAILQSVASQTMRHATDPEAFRSAFSGRLRALAEVHSLLAQQEWGLVDLDQLIGRLVVPVMAHKRSQLHTGGDRVSLPADHAIGLAMALHELATNAMAHGALRSWSGEVDISWHVQSEPKPALQLVWIESGGPSVSPPEDDRFGNIVIRHSLDKIISSEVQTLFRSDGFEARLLVPLS